MSNLVIVDVADGVMTITLNRPERKNALSNRNNTLGVRLARAPPVKRELFCYRAACGTITAVAIREAEMTLEGTVVNGVIVLNGGAQLPEGVRVQVEVAGYLPYHGDIAVQGEGRSQTFAPKLMANSARKPMMMSVSSESTGVISSDSPYQSRYVFESGFSSS